MKETFVWTGENPQVPEPNELVGREFRLENGRRGVVVSNTLLTITVKWEPFSRLRAWIRSWV